ncbi:MAG TPA: hypothetical protein DHK64_09945, partial [Rhodobiaceae bacterium]|nr:hypothetical protein [Rhodobiaceae bacterium]
MTATEEDGSRFARGRAHLRDFAARWTGTRTFVASSAILLLFLAVTGALHPIAAILSFFFLAGISGARFMAVGETAPIRIGRSRNDESAAALSGGAAVALLDRLPDPVLV